MNKKVLHDTEEIKHGRVTCSRISNILGFTKTNVVKLSSEHFQNKKSLEIWSPDVLVTDPRAPENEAKYDRRGILLAMS